MKSGIRNFSNLKTDRAEILAETAYFAYSEKKVLNGSEIEKKANFVW